MKKTRFYPTIWSTAPYAPSVMAGWYGAETQETELILRNEPATALRVSEMSLNITKLSAIDEHGEEHFIIDFPGQNPVTLKGISSGNFIRSKSVLSLPEGKYSSLRFYMAGWGNQFIYQDGVAESANSFERLDFQIENGFEVEKSKAPEVKLWFDFAPYQWKRHFKPLTDLFIGSKSQKPRLANMFGN
ncbi:MAG: hypothetical protein VX772_10650 [Bacteroidota bacterium]|uniref:DUF2846 domain-containing protein n=1 Tax=Flagellimonas okinawensis TaxID=3031324 RepID=A0ABT5XNS4_9FLAO|nr:hypothetical protein [[Muricauda] okinawensis]MDF0707534.1 hypothetical protein [[Muricauda] okinawensis]MEC8832808.1 hypothetical protein [Bacteroidota bacterium]